jgi:tetratricopeptide (TPR) repeat protein
MFLLLQPVYGQASSEAGWGAVQVGSALGAAHALITTYGRGSNSAVRLSAQEITRLESSCNRIHKEAIRMEKSGQLAKACRLYDSYLRIRLDSGISGPGDNDVEDVFCKLSSLYYRLGKQQYAEDLLRAAIALNARKYGPGNPSSVRIINTLAGLCFKRKEYKEAASLYDRSARILERQGTVGIVNSLEPATNLARTDLELGQYQDARDVLAKTLLLAEHTFGTKSPKLLPILNLYRDVLCKLDCAGEASTIEERVRSIEPLSHQESPAPH